MLKKLLFLVADNRKKSALATRLRRRRFRIFERMLAQIPRPVNILDLGGTANFWETMDFQDSDDVHLVLLNVKPTSHSKWETLTGDARRLSRFQDGEFDLVFSNSVIEHVGTFEDQKAMAREVRRVGKGFFVQTPNRYFPIEPHFLFPLFQFLPRSWRIFLVRRFSLGWVPRQPDRESAARKVDEIQLLSGRQVRQLFPEAEIHRERFLGLTKSFIAVQPPAAEPRFPKSEQ